MISLKDYAKSKNITYEAVRQQVNRYRADLGEHITKQGRTQYLDDAAVAFLDERRKESPVVVYNSDRDEEIKRLQEENKALLVRIAELQESLLQEKDQVKALQADKMQLQAQAIALLEEKQEQQAQEKPQKKGFWARLFGE